MIGVPMFAGFASKLQFGLAAVASGNTAEMVAVVLALAGSSMLNAIYFIRTTIRIYSTKEDTLQGKIHRVRDGAAYVVPMLVLTAGNLFLGLFSWAVVDLIRTGLSMFC